MIPTAERNAMREWIADQKMAELIPVDLALSLNKWSACLDALDEAEQVIAATECACECCDTPGLVEPRMVCAGCFSIAEEACSNAGP